MPSNSSHRRLLRGITTSCLLICSLTLAQYVKANEQTDVTNTESSPSGAITVAESGSPLSQQTSEEQSSAPAQETAASTIHSEETEQHVTNQGQDTNPTEEKEPVSEVTTSEEQATTTEEKVTENTQSTETTPNSQTENDTKPAITAVADNSVVSPATTVYMDVPNTFDITVQNAQPITWTIENLPSNSYDIETGTFSGNPLLATTSTTDGIQTTYQFTLKPLFGEDLSQRWPTNIRRTYRQYMGTYTLKGTDSNGKTIVTKELTLRPYQSFMTHEELMATVDDIEKNHADDRLVQVDTIGKSAENRPIRMGIVAQNQASIDQYLNQTTPLMLTNPDQALQLLAQGKLDYKLPILINNTHADEQPGIDIVRDLFQQFARESVITFNTVDKDNQPKTVTIDVPKLLEKVILLFNFTENPDGDVNNTRALANGLDPNRDTSYQTNPETRAIVEQINKWNPIALFDVHGYVKEFLIEPATPPHDPNFEYDIFEEDLVEEAREMGRAGITNSKYNSYIIPKFDYGSGWDDSFSGYTAVYALYHGILGHTIEIPEGNEESYKAGLFAVLAGVHYDFENSDKLMRNRLTYYSRGTNKVEAPSAEKPLVSVDGSVKGRVKNGKDKFFPDYYVIPMELSSTNDVDQAYKMIDYFRRNGVLLNQLTKDIAGFKKGDLVVDMAQAKRGYANHVLYTGSNESEWPAMYAELVVNFPAMRGFKSEAVYQSGILKDALGPVTWSAAPRSASQGNTGYYIISNNSLSAVQAINAALKDKHNVYLTDDGYVVDSQTFNTLISNYSLYAQPINKKPVGTPLRLLKVFSPGNPNRSLGFPSVSEATLALQQMGFEVVTDFEQADIVVLDNSQFDKDVLGKKPTIVIGGSAMSKLEKLGLIQGFDAAMTDEENGNDYEGLMKIQLDVNSPYTSGYAANSLYYANSGSWIEAIPAGFTRLASIQSGDFYLAGWWPGHQGLAGKTVAISGQYQGQALVIFAGNPMNKTHTINFYRWVSNAIFGTQLATFEDIVEPPLPDQKVDPASPDHKEPVQVQVHTLSYTNVKKETPLVAAPAQQLPATGESQNGLLTVTGFLLLIGGCYLDMRRKQSDK